MPKDYLEIIDTAVKIGLGASISGIAAFAITKLNNNHDKNKELINRRLNTIESITEDLIEYFNDFSLLMSAINVIYNEETLIYTSVLENISEKNNKCTSSRGLKNKVILRLELLKLKDTIKILNKADKLNLKITDIIYSKEYPNKKEFLEWKKELLNTKEQVFESLSNHYSK